jgi:hypothetical protein
MSRNHQQAFLELWQDNHRIQINGSPHGTWNLGPVINPCLERYAIKLIKALHVKAAGAPSTATASIEHIMLSKGYDRDDRNFASKRRFGSPSSSSAW